MNRVSRIGLFVCLLLLLGMRLFDVASDPFFRHPPKPQGDGVDYEQIGWNLSIGRGFAFDWGNPDWRPVYLEDERASEYSTQLSRFTPYHLTTARPPLLPFAIATSYRIFGRNGDGWSAIRCFNASLLALSGTISVWLAIRLLFQLGFPHIVAYTGGLGTLLLACFDRTTSTYASDFLTEPMALVWTQLFALVLAITIQSANSAPDGSRRSAKMYKWSWLVLGVLFGALILTRSIAVLMLPGMALLVAYSFPPRIDDSTLDKYSLGTSVRRWRWSLLVALTAIAFSSPWWIRNCIVLERWMPLGTQGATTLLGGYSDESLRAYGEWQPAPEQQLRLEMESNAEYLSAPNEVAKEILINEEASKRVRGWIREHLADLPELAVGRAYQLWSPFTGKSLVWKLAMVMGLIAVFAYRMRDGVWLIGIPVLTTLIVMGLYSTGNRFMVPCYGLLYTLAGIGIGSFVGSVGKIWARRSDNTRPSPCNKAE